MLLTSLIALPLLGGIACYLMRGSAALVFARAVAAVTLVIAVAAALSGEPRELIRSWIPTLGIAWHLKLDGVNLFLLVLTPLLTLLSLFSTHEDTSPAPVRDRLGEFCGHLLITAAFLDGLFLAQNLGLFYIFWESMLLPVLMLAARFGGLKGRASALKFFLYTLAGSLPMLLGVLYLGTRGGAADLSFKTLAQVTAQGVPDVVLLLFFLGFAVKVPIWPLHGWLPDLYDCLPAPAAAVVAGAMSKAGVYGFLKIGLGLFPTGMQTWSQPISILALISLLYGAVCALGAPTLRGVLAYSSLSHLGMMLLGAFSVTVIGKWGCVLQMLNHGLCTGGLFLVLAALEERQLPGELSELGGLGPFLPRLSALFMVLALASLGLPGLCSFAGELAILVGVWQVQPARAALATVGVILSAWYLLRMYQGAMNGPVNREISNCDLVPSEWASLLPLTLLTIWIGLCPAWWYGLLAGHP